MYVVVLTLDSKCTKLFICKYLHNLSSSQSMVLNGYSSPEDFVCVVVLNQTVQQQLNMRTRMENSVFTVKSQQVHDQIL